MYRQNDNDKTDCKKKFDHPTYSLGHTLSKYIYIFVIYIIKNEMFKLL